MKSTLKVLALTWQMYSLKSGLVKQLNIDS